MIQLFHVSKAYPGDAPALVDVNLHVGKGEFVFLSGPSGAGKSTLLKLVFAQEAASKGQVIIDGQNVARLDRRQVALLRRRIGVVFQDFKLLSTRSVFDNVAVSLVVLGWPSRVIRRKAMLLLRYVGLTDKAHVLPCRLSGGEQQRVAIARALAADPAILLADEPTGNLDAERSMDIMELLSSVSARGTAVLVATHDRALLAKYARRVVLLDSGRVVGDGQPEFAGASAGG